jgi:hypothetical protein
MCRLRSVLGSFIRPNDVKGSGRCRLSRLQKLVWTLNFFSRLIKPVSIEICMVD